LKEKTPRKQSLYGKKAASFLLKLFIGGNKEQLYISNVNNIQSMIPGNLKNKYIP